MRLIHQQTQQIVTLAELNDVIRLANVDDIAQHGYLVIQRTTPPTPNMIQSVTEGQPVFNGTDWVETWVVNDLTTNLSQQELATLHDKILTIRKQELASLRYDKEVTNLTVNGMTIMGDRESRNTLLSALTVMTAGMISSIDWKMANGWVTIDTATITVLSNISCNYVKQCFSIERYHSEILVTLTDIHDLVDYDMTTNWPSTTFTL
jgi:hypothetical protein